MNAPDAVTNPADIAFVPKLTEARLDLPPATSDRQSVLAMSLHKAGSTLLFDMLQEMAHLAGLTYFSPEDVLFNSGRLGHNRPSNVGDIFHGTGYCYGGFRAYPAYGIPLLDTAPAIFLMRDPRDILVSFYFSIAYSHKPPSHDVDGVATARFEKQRENTRRRGIDRWITGALPRTVAEFASYAAVGITRRSNVRIYRYEDVIFRKREWLSDIAGFYGWQVDAERLAAIADKHDIRRETEAPGEHVRNVTPGNYRDHLKPETIRRIEILLADHMKWYGYEKVDL